MIRDEGDRPEEATAGHLEPDELGAFLDGALRGEERSRVEAHLVSCARCREEAIHVGRNTVRGGGGSRSRRLVTWAAPVAVAAAVAGILFLGPGAEEVSRTEGPVLRTEDEAGSSRIQAVAPVASGRPPADSVVFTWRAVDSGVVYRLTLLDEEGAVLWQSTVEDTSLALPAHVELRPDVRYYWYVDALLELARTATSGVQEFTASR